jgi:uncharacterized protein (TIGR02452 family)
VARTNRKQLAEQTLQIIRQGWYESASGRRVEVGESISRSVAATTSIRPQDWDDIHRSAAERAAHGVGSPSIEVTGETTLAAARRLSAEHDDVLALNFASAKNPGGGFLGGSQAQEESLARSSALYATLQAAPDYYAANRRCDSAYYTEWMIHSPAVPVFRDDDGTLLDQPDEISFITAPAANASALRQHGQFDAAKIQRVMLRRTVNLLALAASRGHGTLVLGAWGCGVFGNDPAVIAGLFAEALAAPLGQSFRHVTFAVYDRSPGQDVLRAFQTLAAGGPP